jgi:uncharacterized protein YndB with AHSA1/START domain
MTERVNYKFEFSFKAKDELLYTYLSTSYNLSAWFADDVQIKGETIYFTWNKATESAKIVKKTPKKKIVFKWLERDEEEFLTFKIDTDEVTNGTILIVSDFDDKDQVDEARMWWENTIQRLKRVIGG